jgi:hypothetical protein
MSVEAQIAEWRAYASTAPAVEGRDVDELEAHLRDQIAELNVAGLSDDEAFLVAVKRMGDLDALSREFAREHSDRLWKQLVLSGGEESARLSTGWLEAGLFAAGAAIAMQIARLAAHFPEDEPQWLGRNIGLIILPFLAAYFVRRRQLDARGWFMTLLPFAVFALVVNLYPFKRDSSTEVLVVIHLIVLLWFVIGYPYMSGDLRTHERRMDFVRFTGEWIIYYVLIALGGGVLMGLTALILEPLGSEFSEQVIEWVLPSGAAGAVIVAAWLVESKQHVVENMAPVLTLLFTPLFAVMLTVASISYAITGVAGEFDRELLSVFDALMVVVLGLVLYSMSARESARPPGVMDRVQLVAVAGALVLDLLVLGSMMARVGDLGFTANRIAALGLNLLLLVNLGRSAWLSLGFLRGSVGFARVERWQTTYLPVFALWLAAMVIVLPPLFSFE